MSRSEISKMSLCLLLPHISSQFVMVKQIVQILCKDFHSFQSPSPSLYVAMRMSRPYKQVVSQTRECKAWYGALLIYTHKEINSQCILINYK